MRAAWSSAATRCRSAPTSVACIATANVLTEASFSPKRSEHVVSSAWLWSPRTQMTAAAADGPSKEARRSIVRPESR